MTRTRIRLTCAVTLVAVATFAFADDKDKSGSPKDSPAKAAFEKMKSLVGTWTTNSDDMEMKNAKVKYRLTAGGSTVMETIMPGSEHEMVTMYGLDGDKIVLTHYCVMGNQPHMVSKAGLVGNKIEFVCDGHGGNMKSENDMHMHSATFTFTDDDHVKTVWDMYKDGKATDHRGTFNMTRDKK